MNTSHLIILLRITPANRHSEELTLEENISVPTAASEAPLSFTSSLPHLPRDGQGEPGSGQVARRLTAPHRPGPNQGSSRGQPRLGLWSPEGKIEQGRKTKTPAQLADRVGAGGADKGRRPDGRTQGMRRR